jgi:hypothetical protein
VRGAGYVFARKQDHGRFVTIGVRTVLATICFYVGALKEPGVLDEVEVVTFIDVRRAFDYFRGLVEMAGALALLLPELATPAATMLSGVSFLAIIAQATRTSHSALPIGDVIALDARSSGFRHEILDLGR